MGWVKDQIQEEENLPKLLPNLWNAMRDSIGAAADDFNDTISDASDEWLEAVDCQSMGRFCRRVTKCSGMLAIEVFLDVKERELKVSERLQEQVVCQYRMATDGTRAEFFTEGPEGPIILTVEQACRMALKDFILRKVNGSLSSRLR